MQALDVLKSSANLKNITLITEKEAEKLAGPEPEKIVIALDRDGQVTLGGKEKMAIEALAAHLKKIAERVQYPDLPIMVRAAEDTPYGHVSAVLDQVKKAGLHNVSFATEAKKETAKAKEKNPDKPTSIAGGYENAWSAEGRVTDADGKPLADVEISVHAGHGTLRRTGFTKSGADGRYEVKFSRGMLGTVDSPNLQVAQITAHLPGHVEVNLSRHGNGAMALRDVPEEDLQGWGIKKAIGLALPDKPRKVDFVMVPAVRIEGRLVGTGAFSGLKPDAARKMNPILPRGPYMPYDKTPLAGWRVRITGDRLPPGSSIWDSATTDKDGRFVFENVPAGFEWHFETDTNIPDHKQPVSREFTLAAAAEKRAVGVTLELKADQKKVNLAFGNDPAAAENSAAHESSARAHADRYQPADWSDENHAKLPFGPANDDGLRVARFFEPMQEVYEMGAQVKGRIVFHNAGKAPVEFTTEDWHQRDEWHCRDADDAEIRPEVYERMGVRGWHRFRLEPGEVCEVAAQGTAIGTVPFDDEPGDVYWTSKLPEAKPGDAITCAWDVTYTPKGTDKETTLRSGDFTFQVKARPADFPVDLGIARRLGKYHLAEGIKLQLSRSPSKTTATIERDDGRRHQLALEHRDRENPIGLITWWRGGGAFWIAGAKQLRKIDFADPDKVTETKWDWEEAPEDFGGAPDFVREKIDQHRRANSASTDSAETDQKHMAQKYQLHIDGFEFGADAESNYLKLDLRNDQPHTYTIAETQMETEGTLWPQRHRASRDRAQLVAQRAVLLLPFPGRGLLVLRNPRYHQSEKEQISRQVFRRLGTGRFSVESRRESFLRKTARPTRRRTQRAGEKIDPGETPRSRGEEPLGTLARDHRPGGHRRLELLRRRSPRKIGPPSRTLPAGERRLRPAFLYRPGQDERPARLV